MKQLFYLVLAATAFTSYSQTPLIAHKSHSGVSSTYFIDPSSNFGEINYPVQPSQPIENFIPLNDSTMVLEVTDENQNVLKREVLPNKMHYSIMVFQRRYQDSIERQKRQEYNQQMEQEQKIQEQQIIENPPVQESKKKKKKSELLLLSLFVGGGLFGFIALYKRLIYRTAV